MLWTKAFIPTLKETPQEAESASHKLMLRAGLIRMLMAGSYSYLPLGFKVLSNIEKIIRQEMDSCGASELLLPALQPQEIWKRSGRDKDIGEVMFRFVDRRGRNVCLGPTHEEIITELVKSHVSSYKQLPLLLYQIQTKFRDEIRPRFGVVRACEFIMKDAYSFDRDESGLDENYSKMYDAYQRIFKRCGLDFLMVEADSGVMGGKVSHEFMVPAESGEDLVLVCPKCRFTKSFAACLPVQGETKEEKEEHCSKCGVKLEKKNTIEVGHIFKLGTKYSSVLGANFLDGQGKLTPIVMGCYGIGVSRLLAAIIEQNYDENGIIWPRQVSPADAIILPLDVTNEKVMSQASSIYQELKNEYGLSVLLDDRDERAGVKFKDADLLGVTLQVIIGKEFIESGKIEMKNRRTRLKVVDVKTAVIGEIIKAINEKDNSY